MSGASRVEGAEYIQPRSETTLLTVAVALSGFVFTLAA